MFCALVWTFFIVFSWLWLRIAVKPFLRVSLRPVVLKIQVHLLNQSSIFCNHSNISHISYSSNIDKTFSICETWDLPAIFGVHGSSKKNPDWIDMISMEFLKNHPAFVKPPPNRLGVPVCETIRENPSIDELLTSKHYSALLFSNTFP